MARHGLRRQQPSRWPDLGDLLEDVETQRRCGRREEWGAAALHPQHRLAVGTATEDVAPIETHAGPRDGAGHDLVGRIGGSGSGVAKQAARRARPRHHRPHVEVG